MFFKTKKAGEETGPLGPGQFGPYNLKELINRGGMAEIWLATDGELQTCAVRLLHDDLGTDKTARKRFVAGCEVLSQIHNHNCVIGYFDHGKIEGTLFLAMEYVEGENLKLMYSAHDPVLLENVGNIIIDMATGLEHVHQSGFMHLDFKPENVLVTRNASVRLVDFDLALPIPKSPKKLDKNPGTPAYMAPEQLTRGPVDQRADIFAFGVSTYELLTNCKPFPGEKPSEILASQIDRASLVPPRQYNPDIPPDLEKVILKCIQQDPDMRYPLMSMMVHDLKAALYV